MGKINIILKNNLKLFFQKKWLIVSALLFPLMFFALFSLLFISYEGIHQIPIAVIDDDATPLSSDTMMQLKDNPALHVRTTTLKEAHQLLRNQKIEGIFILKSGFEKGIMTSEYQNIIQLIYLDDSPIGPALSDIIASDIMTPLTLYKAANEASKIGSTYGYDHLFDNTVRIGKTLIHESYFSMPIDSQIIMPKTLIEQDIDSQKLLRVNTTIGYCVVVMTFILMFINSQLVDGWSVKKRLMVSGFKSYHFYLGDTIAFVISGSIIMMLQVLLLVVGLKIHQPHAIIHMIAALTCHVILISQLVLLLTALFKKKTTYQSLIAPLIFIMGLLGGAFWSTDVLSQSLLPIIRLSPIYWTLKWINYGMMPVTSQDQPLQYAGYIVFVLLLTIGIYHYKQNKLRNP